MKNKTLTKTISILIIITFLTGQVADAASFALENSDKLAVQSLMQNTMMTPESELEKQSFYEDAGAIGSVLHISEYLEELGTKGIEYLETVVKAELGENPLSGIDASRITYDKGVITIPYTENGTESPFKCDGHIS